MYYYLIYTNKNKKFIMNYYLINCQIIIKDIYSKEGNFLIETDLEFNINIYSIEKGSGYRKISSIDLNGVIIDNEKYTLIELIHYCNRLNSLESLYIPYDSQSPIP